MGLFIINLGLDANQTQMVKDIFKYSIIIIFFHFYLNLSNVKNYGLNGELLNENFLFFLLILIISFMTYYLVVLEIININ